jgi:serine/threonine protein kinase
MSPAIAQISGLPKVVADRYELQDKLADGGSADAYPAWDRRMLRTVLLKISHHRLTDDVDEKRRADFFLKEADTLTKVRHPLVPTVYDLGVLGDGEPEASFRRRPYIVMEYFPDTVLLRVRRQENPVSISTAIRWAADLAGGIESFHRVGIKHRDLSFNNILVTREGEQTTGDELRIIDFGIAWSGLPLSGEGVGTSTETLPATLGFIPPEALQSRAEARDERVDLYAFGVLLFYILAGRLPFEGDRLEVLNKLSTTSVPPVRQFNRGAPKDLAAICDHALKEKAHAYSSATQIREDLECIASGLPLKHARKSTWVYRATRKVARHRIAVVLFAVFAISVYGLGALFIHSRGSLVAFQRQVNDAMPERNHLSELVEDLRNAPEKQTAEMIQTIADDIDNLVVQARSKGGDWPGRVGETMRYMTIVAGVHDKWMVAHWPQLKVDRREYAESFLIKGLIWGSKGFPSPEEKAVPAEEMNSLLIAAGALFDVYTKFATFMGKDPLSRYPVERERYQQSLATLKRMTEDLAPIDPAGFVLNAALLNMVNSKARVAGFEPSAGFPSK